MTPADALRYLDHEARLCREHDAHEALCLLLPALMRLLELPAMDDYEALSFRVELHDAIHEGPTSAKPHSARHSE